MAVDCHDVACFEKGGLFMKRIFLPSFILLICTLIIATVPTDAEGRIYNDTLRLHIIAESDSEESQEIKLEIRDLLLEKYSSVLSSSDNIDSAKAECGELLDEMEKDVNIWLTELGCESGAAVTLTEEWYDTREYEDFTLPRGYYSSLRIIIGEGEGRNWWCVMYPPLCLDLSVSDAPTDDGIADYSAEEIRLISSDGYNVKFKLLEIISDIFS